MAQRQILQKRTRLIISLIVGLIVAGFTSRWGNWWLSALAGWDGFVVVLITMIWRDFAGHDGDQMARIVKREDMGSFAIDAIVILTSIASIVAVLVIFTSKSGGLAGVIFGLASIIASWLTVQTLYTLRYAALYYRGDEGGIDFNQKERPRASDFAYLAFTMGMTYQVSDTNLTRHEMRRAALTHALISFVFGVVIIAMTISAVASSL